ncbi:MAG: type II toxin-antitoxin system RelE/ParE family toxin [Flammeovirgaceae bacterium]
MVQVKWAQLAKDYLKEIYFHVARDSVKFAKIQTLKIRDKSKILAKHPLFGKPVPEYRDNRYRELIEGRYRIIYKLVNETRIDILTIHHSAKNLVERKME